MNLLHTRAYQAKQLNHLKQHSYQHRETEDSNVYAPTDKPAMKQNNVRFTHSIHDIGKESWDILSTSDNPFLRFEFLAALEDCQCIDSPTQGIPLNSGWIPHYAIVENEQQAVVAIAPVFKKLHSYGEYVFDWAWADAYQRHGLQYYPKLVWAIPFTPSTGPRMVSQGNQTECTLYHQLIAEGLTDYCQTHDFSGWHCLFPNSVAQQALASTNSTVSNTMNRTSCQFHWFNRDNNGEGLTDFTHYLEKFTSRKRKNIKKERARLLESGFSFHQKSGFEIDESDIENFYHCYQLTYAKRNSRGYLTLAFFKQLLKTMPEQLLLVQAHYNDTDSRSSKVVANALYFKDADNLYGRYWGCLEEFDSVHFECCYYQGIEYCIEHNLSHFDPGTQGEHKISRGFEPTICHSQHWIAHPEFRQAIDDFLTAEKSDVDHYASQASDYLPFKIQIPN